ncbi:MAG: Hpt domain-containing protein [Flavobacteriales bacterium]|nr:Hpt domain-containing protein [Flavobacteriales bacterium]
MNTQHPEQLFDLSYLNQVFQGNKEMINNIIKLFLEQVPEYIKEMEDCVDRNDLLGLHPLAHKAKSSVSMLGLKSMEKNILDIEQFSKEHRNLEGLPDLVGLIRTECDVVQDQLEKVLNS